MSDLSEAFKKVIFRYLETISYSIYVEVTKHECLQMTDEEKEFIGNKIVKYRRDTNVLRPKSFVHFLSDSKYSGTDTILLSLDFEELMSKGVIKIREVDGFKYLFVGDELVDPKKYYILYKENTELLPSLFKGHDYLDFWDKFRHLMQPDHRVGTLTSLSYDGIHFTLYPELLEAQFFSYRNESETPVHIDIHVTKKRPSADDVYKIAALIKELVSDVIRRSTNLAENVFKETGYATSLDKVSAFIDVNDYKVENYYIRLSDTLEFGRKTISRSLTYYVNSGKMFVELKGEYSSQFLTHALYPLGPRDVEVGDEKYTFLIDRSSRRVGLKFYKVFNVTEESVPISSNFKVVFNLETILTNLLNERIEEIRDTQIVSFDRYGRYSLEHTYDTLARRLDWSSDQTYDETIIKLICLKLILPREHEPNVFDIFVSQAILRGFSQDKLMEKVNEPLDTLISYFKKGRIKLVEKDNEYRFFMDGKPMKIDLMSFQDFLYALTFAEFLVSDEKQEKLEEKAQLIPSPL